MNGDHNQEALRRQLNAVGKMYFLGTMVIVAMAFFLLLSVSDLVQEVASPFPEIPVLDTSGQPVEQLPPQMQVQMLPSRQSALLPLRNLVLLDVRPPTVAARQGLFQGALAIPLAELEARARVELSPDATILVLCGDMRCSQQAAHWLQAQGFQDVHPINEAGFRWLLDGLSLCPPRCQGSLN